MGNELMASTQGTVLSSLLARAISIAPADQGLVNSIIGFVGMGAPLRVGGTAGVIGLMREGDIRGEEKERRYSAMKKSSFMAQKVKRTFCKMNTSSV
jgi:hypothetical protein